MFEDFPSAIRVGPFDIPVTFTDRDDDEWGAYIHGVSIELRKIQPNKVFAIDTVLHELGHGIYKTCSLGEHSTEEQICSAMATGLTQILRDNPELLAWIIRALK